MKLHIYYGGKGPLKAVGKRQCKILSFAFLFPCWHYYPDTKAGRKAVDALVKRGVLVADYHHDRYIIAIYDC